MTHKLILNVKQFQLSGAKRFGTVEEKPPGDSTLPYDLGLMNIGLAGLLRLTEHANTFLNTYPVVVCSHL